MYIVLVHTYNICHRHRYPELKDRERKKIENSSVSRPIRDVTRQTRKPPESKRVLFIAAGIVRPDELGQVDCAPQFAAGPWKPTL